MDEFLEGNEAIVRGAIDAGCRFFAGYPITPATSILLGMMRELPKVGGVAIQGEDEIASIGFCIGAAVAGWKAMTATSGPGLSLYSENVGLAIMGETPLVIVDVQRLGPATGGATMGAEGDIQFLRWGTSGGIPIIALSPTTVAECYAMTIRAFNLAERFRCPVFLATNKELGLTRERVDLDAVERPALVERRPAPPEGEFVPYRVSRPEEVPAFAPLGGSHLVRYTTSIHDERGHITKDSRTAGRAVEHLAAKIAAAADEIALTHLDAQEGAETLVVAYGMAARSAREAVRMARSRGSRVSLLTLYSLWPVPERAIRAALAGARRVVVPEMNLGQYVLEVERIAADRQVVGVGRMDSCLIPPEEIMARGGLA